MASSSSKALRLASLPGPPPTPTSLLDLPQPWLLQLVICKGLDRQRASLLAFFRTCTFLRDAVARHRTAAIAFNVPIDAEDFPAEVEWLCTVARRSTRVRLVFEGQQDEDDEGPGHAWTETEPHITHLLVCAMAQLGGEQPLACVKEIQLTNVEQTALVPAWVKVLCPNATKLDLSWDTLAPHPLHQPRPHPHMRQLEWGTAWGAGADSPLAEHVREQLAALPSLTSLALWDLDWAGGEEEHEQHAGRLISSTVTRLQLAETGGLVGEYEFQPLHRLPTQFPNLRELDAHSFTVRDGDVEALLLMPHLEQLLLCGFLLQCSHAHRACRWGAIDVYDLDVGSFGRLPLDGIQDCCGWWRVLPSTDAAAVARVAQAVRRWGGMRDGMDRWRMEGDDVAALVTTLGPLLAALPTDQQQRVTIHGVRDATPQQVQQLGQQLPASVATLRLSNYTLAPDAWPALLPNLPATVEELRLECTYPPPTEQQVLALCRAAVRPIRLVVHAYGERDLECIRTSLVGPEQQPSLVTLVGDE